MKLLIVLLLFGTIVVSLSVAQSVNESKRIFEVETKHEFSSETTQDLFKLTVRGANLVDGIISFQIFTAKGKEIYNEHFTVGELMEFGPDEKDKAFRRNTKDSIFIMEVLNQFFDERNFAKPAVGDTAEMQNNYSSYKDWNLIREDSTATAFQYLLGAEDGRKIAYSKKKKKVILYFTCC